ncbi:MAG: patatin-like phospholipase family protein [Holosporaceae bacterium]|nr:patatin-like phospholipase family protein [Holosporaceae bacterium]
MSRLKKIVFGYSIILLSILSSKECDAMRPKDTMNPKDDASIVAVSPVTDGDSRSGPSLRQNRSGIFSKKKLPISVRRQSVSDSEHASSNELQISESEVFISLWNPRSSDSKKSSPKQSKRRRKTEDLANSSSVKASAGSGSRGSFDSDADEDKIPTSESSRVFSFNPLQLPKKKDLTPNPGTRSSKVAAGKLHSRRRAASGNLETMYPSTSDGTDTFESSISPLCQSPQLLEEKDLNPNDSIISPSGSFPSSLYPLPRPQSKKLLKQNVSMGNIARGRSSLGQCPHCRRVHSESDSEAQNEKNRRVSWMKDELSDQEMMMDQLSLLPRSVAVPREDVKIMLSIDGGGVRGIIPLLYIMEIEKALGIRSFNGVIDVLGGTSIGALVSVAIATNREEDVFNRFLKLAKAIFTKSTHIIPLQTPIYKSTNKLEVIKQFTDSQNRPLLSNELSFLTFITFYNFLTQESKLIGSDDRREIFNLHDLLMMSSAAPTYFDPYECDSVDTTTASFRAGQHFLGGDGGIFANNPALMAYSETRKRYPNSKIVVISLGTGKCNSFKNKKEYKDKGLLAWAGLFPDIAIASTSSASQQALDCLAASSGGMLEHIRIQPALEEKLMTTDETEKIFQLNTAARESISPIGSERDRMNRVIEILTSRLRGEI